MHRLTMLAIPAAMLLAVSHTPAQQSDAGRPPVRAASAAENRPPMPIVDVDFAGGTVREFVRAVQKASMASAAKTPVNVMVPAEAADIVMPAISLKQVSAETALQTLAYAFTMTGPHRVGLQNMTNAGDQGLTFAIQYQFIQQDPQMRTVGLPGPVLSEAYSLRDLLETPEGLPRDDPALRMAPDAVLGALKLAVELADSDARAVPMQLLFHPESQLLIARGRPEQHRLVTNVLKQLGETLGQRRMRRGESMAREQAGRLSRIEFEAKVQHAESHLSQARAELAEAENRAERMRRLAEQGQAGAVDVEEAIAETERARARFRAAEIDFTMLLRQREVLESGGGWTGAPAGEAIVAVYDLRDFAGFKGEFIQLVKLVVGEAGSMDVRPAPGDADGALAVRAPRDRHEIVVSIFNAARRLKQNDPRLPGVTLEQVIEKAKE